MRACREVRDLEPLEQLVDRRAAAGAEADVREDVEVREERVLLEEVADAAAAPAAGRCRASVSSHGASSSATTPARGPEQAGDDPQHRRLPGARRTDERHRGAVLDRQRDGGVEAAKGMGEVDVERHRVNTLTSRRVVALMITSSAADREGDVEVDVELLVDRERERLGDALRASPRT